MFFARLNALNSYPDATEQDQESPWLLTPASGS